ncbi:MAG: DUF362 domain-containing protein [Candidatus Gottesmanbacteria bacterium]
MINTKVSLVKGYNRYQNIAKALRLLEEDLGPKISRAKNIIIKPNFVSTSNQLAATHVDAIKATLDFLQKFTKNKILIAENAAFASAFEGYKNFGYMKLVKKYHIELVDLAKDDFQNFSISSAFGKRIHIGVSKTILNSDMRISIGPAKTHDEVIVTLSLKNMSMGSLNTRPLMHQGTRKMNLNLAKIAKIVPPHLSIIDGTVGMEGNGPGEGTPIKSNFVVTSANPICADVIAARVMGFNPEDVGYLYYMGIPKNIKIVGDSIDKCQVHFKPHRSYERQLNWRTKENLPRIILSTIIANVYLRVQRMPFYNSTWFVNIKEPIKKILGY